jgi:pimeloyl-ACP methyl ester carboxylesterase
MPQLSRNGADMFYEDRGAGDPVVLVHGIGSHAFFARQVEHLARSHRVLAPDLPGFGQSALPTEHPCALRDYAADVAWLCDQLELEAPVIVGHSMGAAIAFELAAGRPDIPGALVLLDPIPVVPVPALREQRGALATALAGPDYASAFRSFAEARMFRPTDDPAIRADIVDALCAIPQRVLAPVFASVSEWSGEELAPQIRCPVLLVTAGEGLPADLTRTRELIADLELGRVVGAGHFAHVFAAEQVNAMIDRFLAVAQKKTLRRASNSL